ncbi:DUF2712 domain-containing protein [Niallia sp.]|uniref:DUF2712 domain-containing protein n=1 Tax=Niallia sp. TaxID=2837523 RepID=UPI0028A267AB|nr:DUF2712 domain-containing protein [Niallia sp.]
MKKKALTFGLVSLLSVGVLMPNLGHAEDNPREYQILVPNYHGNGQEDQGYLRESGDSRVQWGVSLTNSDEGNGTYTRFWLELGTGANVTNGHDVKEGGGYKQYDFEKASDAKGKKVYLTAENNNYNSSTFEITGEWDEEI